MDISNNNNNAETTIDALASLSLSPEPALSSTVNEDGIVGSADVDTTAAISSTTHKNTNVTIRRTVNHSANDTAANQSSDIVDGLLDDVDAVVTHQELSCMKLGELKELCKMKSLSTKGNMTTLIDRYLLAQKNGFPTKKKPISQSERTAKSRANRSDKKKKEDNKKILAYNTTKVWVWKGKDYTLERHEENPIEAPAPRNQVEFCRGCGKVLPHGDHPDEDVCFSCKRKFCEECCLYNFNMCPACEKRFCQKCDDLSGIGCRQCQDDALGFGFM